MDGFVEMNQISKRLSKRLWLAAEILSWVATVALIGYYVYWFGWLGLAYGTLAAVLGAMIIYWFGDIIPVIGPMMRRWEANKRNSTNSDHKG